MLFVVTTAKPQYLTTIEVVQNALLTFVSSVAASFVVGSSKVVQIQLSLSLSTVGVIICMVE
jgi:hypothetical protein